MRRRWPAGAIRFDARRKTNRRPDTFVRSLRQAADSPLRPMISHPHRCLSVHIPKAAGNSIRWRIEWEPSNADVFLTAPGPLVSMISRAVTVVTGRTPVLSTTGGTSDARFVKHHCPVVEFGLVGHRMHQVDERVLVEQIGQLKSIYKRILSDYFAST